MAFPTQPLISGFDADENPLAGVFTSSNMKALGGLALAASNAEAFAYTTSITSSADCEAYVAVPTLPNPSTGQMMLLARLQGVFAPNGTFYYFSIWPGPGGTSLMSLIRRVAGTDTTLDHGSGFTVQNGDQFGIGCTGTQIICYKNGSVTVNFNDASGGIAGAGSIGFWCNDNTPTFDNFGGGPLPPLPSLSTSSGTGIHERLVNRSIGRGFWRV
jgi:hypothetical protein